MVLGVFSLQRILDYYMLEVTSKHINLMFLDNFNK